MTRSHYPQNPEQASRHLMSSLTSLAALALVLAAGCSKPVQEAGLIGSWQVKIPAQFAPVFTYTTNRTVSLTILGVKGLESQAMVGDWKLEGRELVTVMRSVTNAYGSSAPGLIPANLERVTITELNDSVMVWRSGLMGQSTTLRRIRRTDRRGE